MHATMIPTRKTISISVSSLLLIISILGFNACRKLGNPTEGTKLIVNYDLLKTNIGLEFVDAKTGILIGQEDGKRVKVHIMGESAEAVLDLTGTQKESYNSSRGMISLALNPNAEFSPSEAAPLHITFVASLDGYITTSKQLSVSRDGNYKLRFFMVDKENPPQGVSVATAWNVGSLVSGILQEEINIETQGGEASFTIPAGTRITDADGNYLQASLHLMLAYFDNMEDAALAAFPGGLIARVNQGNQVNEGTFYSAGFVAIDVADATGRQAKFFEENKVELSMKIASQTYNPETASSVAVGDELPLYSYEPDSGLWVYEQKLEIETATSGFQVNTQLTHLSYWNFGWFYDQYCQSGIQIKFTGELNCDNKWMDGVIRKKADNSYLTHISIYAGNESSMQVLNVPKNLPVYIDWSTDWSSCNGCSVGAGSDPIQIPNLCATTTLSIPLSCSADSATSMLEMYGYCINNANVEIRPTFGIWFRSADDYCWQWLFMVDGQTQLCDLVDGQNYIIGMYIAGEWIELPMKADGSDIIRVDMAFPGEFCDQGL